MIIQRSELYDGGSKAEEEKNIIRGRRRNRKRRKTNTNQNKKYNTKNKIKVTNTKEKQGKDWGDTIELADSWPSKTKNNTIRIYSQNVNGISHFNDYMEWNIFLQYMDKLM